MMYVIWIIYCILTIKLAGEKEMLLRKIVRKRKYIYGRVLCILENMYI